VLLPSLAGPRSRLCLATLHLRLAERAAELLGIPDDYTQCALLPVAYTLGTDFRPARRPAPGTIVHWDGW